MHARTQSHLLTPTYSPPQVKQLEEQLSEVNTELDGMADVRGKLREQRMIMEQQRKTISQLQEQLKAMTEQHAVWGWGELVAAGVAVGLLLGLLLGFCWFSQCIVGCSGLGFS